MMHKLKKWELALLCAVALTLLLSSAPGATPCDAWWGAIYPELTPESAALSVSASDGGVVELRLRTLEWLERALAALGLE